MKRFLHLLPLLACLSCGVRLVRAAPDPLLYAYHIYPYPFYQQWLAEVRFCALDAARSDDAFQIDTSRLRYTIDSLDWFAVPTERPDGRFAWRGKLMSGAIDGDSVYLSGQGLYYRRLVKHELLHVLVNSPTENTYGEHGRPWGYCENL